MQRLPEKDSVQEGEWKIFIIGSPSPGEISANHPYQFVNAAICQKVDKNTVWIVERTGYEAGNIDLNFIESSIGEGKLIWITPENSLVAILNTFPANSINSMYVYSHGLVGRITLRYGWEHTGRQNYGLNIPEVLKMKKDIFTGNALISFDSCNSGSSDFEYPYGNIAQQFAQQAGNDVKAWTGRTSYREVNNPSGTCNVEASQIFRGWNKPDFKEMGSRYLFNRVPEQRTYSPIRGIRVGGFQSYFEIKVRLPSTRNFDVPENGSVLVTCPNPDLIIPEEMEEFFRRDYSYTIYGASQETEKSYSRRVTPMLGQFWIALYKSGDVSIGMHVFPVHANSEQAIWSNLSGGSYYLEIYRFAGNTGLPIRSDINVEIYK
ncbi:hypothetical protein HY745_03720 [Candidatus Desantisbacteria bacterium]|nr:hypothetical protein [Candidatus Desantisbacteria bacterium]